MIEIERKKIKKEETKHLIGKIKVPDLKEVMGTFPDTIEMNEDLVMSALGDNPPSDLSYNLVHEFTLMPTKVDPNNRKINKLYPLPLWKETNNNLFYQTEPLDGELVEQFPKKREREHVHRYYGVPNFKPAQPR